MLKITWLFLFGLLKSVWAIVRVVISPIRWPFNAWCHWLHTRWPAGTIEKLPEVQSNGRTNVAGLYIVGDLTGVPLLKFSADSGARAVQLIAKERGFGRREGDEILDLVIIGGGVSGMAAALEARKQDLNFVLLEASEPFSTVANFPKAKPIYTYPTDMVPAGDLQFTATVKEPLLEEMHAQTVGVGIEAQKAMVEKVLRRSKCLETVIRNQDSILSQRVIVAIGRSGNFRRLGVPGETMDKVANRLHDPKDFCEKKVLIVGGGDSALESAIAIAECGGHVDVSYRKHEFSRPKPDNVEAIARLQKNPMARIPDTHPEGDRVTSPAGSYLKEHRKAGSIELHMGSNVKRIDDGEVTLTDDAGEHILENDAVLTMIGREAPLDFFRRSGVKIRGETRGLEWIPITLFFLCIWFIYDWKNEGTLTNYLGIVEDESLQSGVRSWLALLGDWWTSQVADRTTLIGTISVSMGGRSFYYTLLYTLCIGYFGIKRVLRRRTPYVTLQTACLFVIQAVPLFLLPELIFPWLGYSGYYEESGWLLSFVNEFMPLYDGASNTSLNNWGGHPREYWRAYGFILAFPLMVYNVFTDTPLQGWLILSVIQTFVFIPLIVWKWGKGAFCGWICSCGGLAETMGDDQRHKMFHGATSNKWNMVGQIVLLIAFAMLALRIWMWVYPDGSVASAVDFDRWLNGNNPDPKWTGGASYKWMIDVLLGGILGVGFYFKYSGRIWCRFACPLAALMHIYARFTKFRIIPEKSKCISCNVCTTNCHMGIDVMNFANKGMPMEDPQCVRCSACVQTCPTGVLQFGEVKRDGTVRKTGWLPASPVRSAEKAASGAAPSSEEE